MGKKERTSGGDPAAGVTGGVKSRRRGAGGVAVLGVAEDLQEGKGMLSEALRLGDEEASEALRFSRRARNRSTRKRTGRETWSAPQTSILS